LIASRRSRRRFFLAGHEDAAVHRDDVDLSFGAPPVAGQDPESRLLQVLRGELLALPAQGILGVQADHLRFRRSRNRRRRGGSPNALWRAGRAAASGG
jgi:hypothetical protein